MILLVSGASATLRRFPGAALGHLLAPRDWASLGSLLATGRPIAADNDCFQGLDRTAYIRMLRRLAPYAERILWVSVPDVVGDAEATLRRWTLWRPALRYYGLRAAYVAQDGATEENTPWAEMDALFIGGTTKWKLGPEAARLIRSARARDLWVHVGWVNSPLRLRSFSGLDISSFDGTGYSRFARRDIPAVLPHLAVRQHRMAGRFHNLGSGNRKPPSCKLEGSATVSAAGACP